MTRIDSGACAYVPPWDSDSGFNPRWHETRSYRDRILRDGKEKLIADLAAKHRLPTMFGRRELRSAAVDFEDQIYDENQREQHPEDEYNNECRKAFQNFTQSDHHNVSIAKSGDPN